MGYSWPTAPDAQGNGATEDDLRQIIGAQYMNQGVLPNGGLTVDGTSTMNYRVNAGAAFMWTSKSQRKGVLVPVSTITIPTAAAPATGTRTDSIYLSTDGIPRVTSSTPPASSVLLGKFMVAAGTTSTLSAQQTIDREHAIATGASLGVLAHWAIPGSTWGGDTGKDVQRHSRQFVVPSDRLVRVDISLSAIGATAGEGWSAFGVEIDGTWRRALHVVYKNGQEQTYSATWTAEVSAGVHELTVFTVKYKGPDLRTARLASASEVNVWDAGVAQ